MTDSTRGQEKMIPNRYFRDFYPELYSKSYPERKLPAHEMSVGMYALTLGIATETGLYDDLRNIYGTQSDKLHSDSWYSDFFSKKISEDQHHAFRIRRIERLVAAGLKKVWLSIDGSNNDCEARQSELAQFGFPKSHNKSKTVVGYMYAVDAATGEPVTYFAYNGSVPDCQAFQKISVFLNSFHIEIEGVILDRGFAVPAVFDSIESYGWKYVIMLPSDAYAHRQMMQEHADEIRWHSDYLLDSAMFGTADTKQLFRTNDRKSRTCLYFDGASGSEQSMKLIRKILSERRKILKAIAGGNKERRKILKAIAGGNKASVSRDLQKYLSIDGQSPDRTLRLNTAAFDESMSSKGFFSMAVSEGISPSLGDTLYRMRDTSETQFSILKTQEGGAATYVHFTGGIQLFGEFSVDQDDLERIAREYNSRSNTDAKSPDRRLPDDRKPVIQSNTHKRGRPRKITPAIAESEDGDRVKSKGGRPKGKKDSKPRKPRSDKGVPRKKRDGIKN